MGRRPARTRLAVGTTRTLNAVSRRLGGGGGTVIGGRAGLALDPRLLERLGADRRLALVSGTNGKTTTTRLLSVALESAGRPVVTNATGANMPAGHVAALAAGHPGAPGVLEVDEGYLPQLVRAVTPEAVVLLNLSRDQLDRTNEVRMTAGKWRRALEAAGSTTVVANADDPLVVWSAAAAPRVVWVAAGLRWVLDAVGCPACGGRIAFAEGGGWHCTGCDLARPEPAVAVVRQAEGHHAAFADGRRYPVTLALPGSFNHANAVMAAVAAERLGIPVEVGLGSMSGVAEVAGRFTVRPVAGIPTRLLLAKNPAGWDELLGLVGPGTTPVVVGINARIADGRDPSWLWDVPFEQLAGRPVVATGERSLDLSVRLRYAGVDHQRHPDPVRAVALAARAGAAQPGAGAPPFAVEFIGNYTAFGDLLRTR